MTGLDFRRCPICGEEDVDLASEERLYAPNRLTVTLGEGGELLAAEWGLTEPDYNTSETAAYYCGCCLEALPEAYQEALDAALRNERRPDESPSASSLIR